MRRLFTGLACIFILHIAGCFSLEDPKVVALRKQIVLSSEPANAITLTDAKGLLETEQQVVLVGKVGSGSLNPFENGKSIFAMSEAPADHGEDPSHNASECPFCKRRAAEAPIATVELCDANGSPFSYGADQLLNLKAGQTVVVEGNALFMPDTDMIRMKSQRIFVRKK
jgi:hypothetical protein